MQAPEGQGSHATRGGLAANRLRQRLPQPLHPGRPLLQEQELFYLAGLANPPQASQPPELVVQPQRQVRGRGEQQQRLPEHGQPRADLAAGPTGPPSEKPW